MQLWRTNLQGAWSLLIALIFVGGASSAAQDVSVPSEAASPDDYTVHTTVRRVIVDVAVTDSAGTPVDGLDAKDFTVWEDGKPQQILSFDSHDLDAADTAAPRLPSLPPNTYVNLPATPERGPLYILLLDQVNTSLDDQARGRAQLLKFIESKPAGTRFAVYVFSDDLYLVQGFTSDPEVLFASLDPHRPTHHIPMLFLYGDSFGANDPGVMLEVFRRIATFVDGLPGRRT